MTRILLALALFLEFATSVHSHGLNLTVVPEGAALTGEARYSDGTPAAGERVSFHNPPDGKQESGHALTGADGRFRFEGKPATAYRVVVEAMEGHRGETLVSTADASGDADPRLAAALRRELAPLREDIARLERHIRLHDILGGVGYLFGLAGIASLILNRRNKPK